MLSCLYCILIAADAVQTQTKVLILTQHQHKLAEAAASSSLFLTFYILLVQGYILVAFWGTYNWHTVVHTGSDKGSYKWPVGDTAGSTKMMSQETVQLRSSGGRRMQLMTSDWTRSYTLHARCVC